MAKKKAAKPKRGNRKPNKDKPLPAIREDALEARFCEIASALGCEPLKLEISGARGFPDRTVICPGGRVCFFEFKTPDGVLSPQQMRRISSLWAMGCMVYVCRSADSASRRLAAFLKMGEK